MRIPQMQLSLLGATFVWLLYGVAVAAEFERGVVAPSSSGVLDAPDIERQRGVYDVSLHDPQAILLLLTRLEQLAQQPNSQLQPADTALVLHGPELVFFTIGKYAQNRDLVDLAAKLDAFQAVEIKACSTKLRALGLQPQDLPAFIEIVPYGPSEVERLANDGYLKM